MTIRQKLEKTISAYLTTEATGTDLAIFEGNNTGELTYPACIVSAEQIQLLTPDTDIINVFAVNLTVSIVSNNHDETASEHDAYVDLIKTSLDDLAAIQTAVNAPIYTPDNRATKDIHIYNIRLDGGATDAKNDRMLGEQLNYVVHCQDVDGIIPVAPPP